MQDNAIKTKGNYPVKNRLSAKILSVARNLTLYLFIFTIVEMLAYPAIAYADTTSALNTIEGQTKSWVYYNALAKCINEQPFGRSESDVSAGKWFGDGGLFGYGATNPTIGYFLSGLGSSVKTDGDHVSCGGDKSSWIAEALTIWGYTSKIDAACDFGALRVNDTPCKTGTGDFVGSMTRNNGSVSHSDHLDVTKFRAAIKAKLGGQEPAYTSAVEYTLYKNAFMKGCIDSDANNNSYKYSIPTVNNAGQTGLSITNTDTYGSPTKSIYFYVNSKMQNVSDSCKNIASVISKAAAAYVNKTNTDLKNGVTSEKEIAVSTTKTENTTDTSTTSCAIPGVGWLICPVVNFMASIADGAFGFLANSFLRTSPKIFDSTGPMFNAWSTMRNIANIAFVIIFLIIIFSQITSFGISNYGIKKMLPRLIIAAILVNISYFICQIAVDLSNMLGYSLKDLLANLVPASASGTTAGGLDITGKGTLFGGIVATAIGAGLIWTSLAAIIPLLLAAVVALVMILFILVARQALIILLIVISPLAFVAFLLPNTNDWFKKWQKSFTAMLMLFPIIALVFGVSSLAAGILTQVYNSDATTNWFGGIAAAAVMILPLFIVPGLLKKSLDSAGSIGTKLNGLGAKWGSSAGKVGSKAYDNSAIARGRAARSQYKQKYRDQNYASKLGSSVVTGTLSKGIPWSKSNRFANERLTSYATAAADKLDEEMVSNRITQIRNSDQIKAGDLKSVRSQLVTALERGDSVEARANARVLMGSGGAGKTKLHEAIEEFQSNPENKNIKNNADLIRKTVLSGGLKANNAALDRWSAVGGDLKDVARSGSALSALSAEELAGQSSYVLTQSGGKGISDATAAAVLANPSAAQKLSEDTRTFFGLPTEAKRAEYITIPDVEARAVYAKLPPEKQAAFSSGYKAIPITGNDDIDKKARENFIRAAQ